MVKKKKQKGIWGLVDNIQGDKVVWMVVIMLILFSIIAIFASSSKLAIQEGTTRLAILKGHLRLVILGFLVIFACYKIPGMGFYRVLSQLGFGISFILLTFLVTGFHTANTNDAVRAISIGGFQIHVYEVVKVAMVMYLAWAVQTLEKDKFWIMNKLAKKFRKVEFFKSKMAKEMVYIFIPIIIVTMMIVKGSLSSALFIGFIMLMTILIGGVRFKSLLIPGAIALVVALLTVGAHFIAPEKILPRLPTWVSRLEPNHYEQDIKDYGLWSEQGQKALDKLRQPEGAKIAIKEGGLMGKGAGRSTQKHVVSVIFGDYMFSFIVEEFGLFGAVILIALYVSLLARGSIIVKNCNSIFAQTAVAGLTLLITGQAFFHMIVNVDVGILTGQTLPLISHGGGSFICFCIAFGVILSISKIAKKNIEKATLEAQPIIPGAIDDNVEATLDELDNCDF